LAEGGEGAIDLIGYEKLIAVEIAVIDSEPPFVSPEIRQLGFPLSPQTGGCESNRGSALGEGLPGKEKQPGADCQDDDEVVSPLAWKPHEFLAGAWGAIAPTVSRRARAAWSHS